MKFDFYNIPKMHPAIVPKSWLGLNRFMCGKDVQQMIIQLLSPLDFAMTLLAHNIRTICVHSLISLGLNELKHEDTRTLVCAGIIFKYHVPMRIYLPTMINNLCILGYKFPIIHLMACSKCYITRDEMTYFASITAFHGRRDFFKFMNGNASYRPYMFMHGDRPITANYYATIAFIGGHPELAAEICLKYRTFHHIDDPVKECLSTLQPHDGDKLLKFLLGLKNHSSINRIIIQQRLATSHPVAVEQFYAIADQKTCAIL